MDTLRPALVAKFGAVPVSNGDPWGASVVHIAGLGLPWVQIWTIITAIALLSAFWLFNRRSRYGLAMRAAASDPEAALSVGISLRQVHAIAWGLAGIVACVGGVFLGGYPNSVSPQISDVALLYRLRAAADWLGEIAGALLAQRGETPDPRVLEQSGPYYGCLRQAVGRAVAALNSPALAARQPGHGAGMKTLAASRQRKKGSRSA